MSRYQSALFGTAIPYSTAPSRSPVGSGLAAYGAVSESRVFDGGVLAVARGLLRPLQHPVNLGEADVAEQRRNHPALRNALFPAGFEHDLQQVHDVGIVHALGYFRQQPIMPDIVEIAAQVDVQRRIGAPDQFVRDLLEERLYALRFDSLEGHPVTSRSPIVPFGQRIRLA